VFRQLRTIRFALTFACASVIATFLLLNLSNAPAGHAAASPASVGCPVIDVSVFVGQRIHVQCGILSRVGTNPPFYFALSLQDPSAALVLDVLEEALNSKQALTVVYESDTSANPSGCLPQDCRKILSVSIRPAP